MVKSEFSYLIAFSLRDTKYSKKTGIASRTHMGIWESSKKWSQMGHSTNFGTVTYVHIRTHGSTFLQKTTHGSKLYSIECDSMMYLLLVAKKCIKKTSFRFFHTNIKCCLISLRM